MILDSETNVCYLSKLLMDKPYGSDLVNQLTENGVQVEFIEWTRDIWARDYMPIQIDKDLFIGYEYAPDYLYNTKYCKYITSQARVCDRMRIDTIQSGLIIDGGNIVKTMRGAIMLDKVIIENRHLEPHKLIERLEHILETEIILLPWDPNDMFGHADGLVREVSPGKVLLIDYGYYSQDHAKQLTEILNRHFDVEILRFNVDKPHPNNWCYINYLQVGDKIFLPQLTPMQKITFENSSEYNPIKYIPNGKIVEEDALALERFKRIFRNCQVIPVSCPELVKEGGALNCISWNIKQ